MTDKRVTKIHEISEKDEPLLALLILAYGQQRDVFRRRVGADNIISAPDLKALERIKTIDALQGILDEVDMGGDIDRGRHYLMLRVAEQVRRYFELLPSDKKDSDFKALEDISKRLDNSLGRLSELEELLEDDEKTASDKWLRNFLLIQPLEYLGHWTVLGKKISHLRKIYRRRRMAALGIAIAAVTVAGWAFTEGRLSIPDFFAYGIAAFVVVLGYLLISLAHLTMQRQISEEIEAKTGFRVALETKEAAEKVKRELAFDLARLGENVAGKSEHLLYHEAEIAEKAFVQTALELGLDVSEVRSQKSEIRS